MGSLCRGLEPLNRRLSSRARREWLSRPGIPLEQKNVPSAAQLEKNGLPRKPSEKSVFLNIPYDPQFSDLCLAYIAGIACFGLTPRATLEIPGGARRLDRILELIGNCEFSIHDLSRVQLNRTRPSTPRFNMPFELGLTVAWQRLRDPNHTWFVFEATRFRAAKSLSDLSGTDIYIHGGTILGVFQQLCHAFINEARRPSVGEMMAAYRYLKGEMATILKASRAISIFDGARSFRDVYFAAILRAERRV
jgi:hypothetical protein